MVYVPFVHLVVRCSFVLVAPYPANARTWTPYFLVAGWANSHADLGLVVLNVELRYRDVDHAARQIASASAAADAASEQAAERPEGIAGKALPRRVAHRKHIG